MAKAWTRGHMDLVTDLLARHRAEVTDRDVGSRLCAVPGRDRVVHGLDGTTTFVDLSLSVTGTAEWSPADWAPRGKQPYDSPARERGS